MALITCPECTLPVSDKALSCPHCGYPLAATAKKKPSVSRKRKRLPNGFGSITERKDKYLRNPFWTRVCVGKTEEGRPILKSLKPQAFFKTYNEAYAALFEYNKNPYDLDDDILLKELYEKWSGQYFENLKSDSSARTITAAWAYCSALYDIRVKDIRPRHIKWVMENGEVTIQRGKKKGEKQKASAGTKARIKSMFNLLLDYAQENEYVTTNYARLFEVSKDIIIEKSKATRSHMVFQDAEMEALWKGAGTIKYADLVLIQCYSGLRPQELGLITLDNVHLDENYIVGGMKTAAGTSRIIPIHPKIKSFVEKYLDEARELKSDYLINASDSINGLKMTYDKYAHRFDAVIEVLHLNSEHRPHDPRTTFVTMAKKSGVDEYVLKMVIGHQITDVTEKYYTKRNIEWLFEEIKKI